VSAGARFVGVGGDGFVGFEVQVAFKGKSELAANGATSKRGNKISAIRAPQKEDETACKATPNGQKRQNHNI